MGLLGNREFAAAVSEWAFHERGVLRASSVRHHPVGSAVQVRTGGRCHNCVFAGHGSTLQPLGAATGSFLSQTFELDHSTHPVTPQPDVYRVSDEVVFSVDIQELASGGQWRPCQ